MSVRPLDPPRRGKQVEQTTRATKPQFRHPYQQVPRSPRTPRAPSSATRRPTAHAGAKDGPAAFRTSYPRRTASAARPLQQQERPTA